ncbi:MAG: hypothetical protein Q9P01_08975 [Anaerolineae bacterium]|nr:hypothetical protein [Anaerolineae bacterium]MDQ7034950.1 hypothetical protein [Anaerolineae bacterium]
MDRGKLMRGLVFGAVAGIIGIGLFVFLFTVALADMEQPARLFTAFFVPILVIGILALGYHFLTR